MCQHDFDGQRVFQHRNMEKWQSHGNKQIPGFEHEEQCIAFIDELMTQWSPAAQTLPTSDDRQFAEKLHGRTFTYLRVKHGQGRLLTFRGNGTFSQGGAGRERYWTIRDERMLICGDDGRLTMDLEPRPFGGWEGRWLLFEKMPILMIPT